MRLDGKVAIVTGAGGGIGRGIVLRLAEEGADVILVDLDTAAATRVADQAAALGRRMQKPPLARASREKGFSAMLTSMINPPCFLTVQATWLGRLVAPEVPATISKPVRDAASKELRNR